jgi:predicted RNA-binding Zn-ribbon protein involved in translation (DUF1610 family)
MNSTELPTLPNTFKFTHTDSPDQEYTAILDDSGEGYEVSWEINGEKDTSDYTVAQLNRTVALGLMVVTPRNMVIAANQVKCTACQQSIYSTHVHHFVTCECGETSVDGGQDYCRRVGSNWEDQSIHIEQEALDLLVKDIEESRESGRNDLGDSVSSVEIFSG